jgi:putative transposase
MDVEIMQPDYRRNLPHFTPNDAPYFVTFNLDGALPPDVRMRLLSGENKFRDFDAYLDRVASGPNWLSEPKLADIVFDRLMKLEKQVLTLYAFTVMSNHVHLMISLHDGQALEEIMRSIKGPSARYCNLALGRRGAFWQHESYDRVLRWNEHRVTAKYIVINPVKAGIVRHWREYKWTYLNEQLFFFE